MKLTLEINKKLFTLNPQSFKILIYYKTFYSLYKKVPSMRRVSEDTKISYHTIRKAVIELYLFLKNDADAHPSLYKEYSFILSKIESVYNKYMDVDKIPKEEEIIWNRILVEAVKHNHKNPPEYYWKIGISIRKLMRVIGGENIDKYIKWFFKYKTHISKFNVGIFCYDGIITEFKADLGLLKKTISSKKRKEVFEEEAKEEEKRILNKLLERKEKGIMDEYDRELLSYYKKQGWLN